MKQVTRRLSNSLHTEVSVKHVNFSLFNRMYLQDALILDKSRDTLLYAGSLKFAITDWFFLLDQAEIRYAGLENAVIHLQRSDSVWNYQFLADYFSKPADTTKKEGIEFMLTRADLKNVVFIKTDGWVGQEMKVKLGDLELDAEEINFKHKKIFANSLYISEPVFSIYNYQGNRPSNNNTVKKGKPPATQYGLRWNPENWDILIHEVTITDGIFRNDKYTERAPYAWFDGQHLSFEDIQASFKELSWQQDTISGKLHLSTRERSGFKVNGMDARISLYPEGMIFRDLDIRTPESHLRNYYSMRFDDFNDDMGHFLTQVNLEGRFINSTISSNDIAYFAPELKKWNRIIKMNGTVGGTIDNLSARNFILESGKDTRLHGDVDLKGLPDISQTLITLTSRDFQTTYDDAIVMIPGIREIKDPNLAELKYIRFRGFFKGYLSDFQTSGLIETGLGNLTADVNMKIPSGKLPGYKGTIQTGSFALGRFINNSQFGNLAFNGKIEGEGFDPAKSNVTIDGFLDSLSYNQYNYHQITVNGRLNQKLFNGTASVKDPNLIMSIDGSFNFDTRNPELNMLAEVQRMNLKELNFTKEDINVLGKFKMNFTGRTIDDFIGEASLYDVAITKSGQTYVFDSLDLNSYVVDGRKDITLKNDDIYANINGIFTINDLPNTATYYLNKYYPTYFRAPTRKVESQDFKVDITLKYIDQYLQLLDPRLTGFDNSTLTGSINTVQKSMNLDLHVPYAGFDNMRMNEFRLSSHDDNDSLRVLVQTGSTYISDSIQLPRSTIRMAAANDVSVIQVTTGATKTLSQVNLGGSVTTLKDGVRIHFNPSTLVLNDKTWQIENGGELTISKSFLDANDVRITNGEQQVLISSIPSEIGNSNDISVIMTKVNLGDFMPFVMKQPRIQGITNAEVTIEDPFNKLRVYVNAQTDQTRFEDDSIGITTLNGYWDNTNKKTSFHFLSDNHNYEFSLNGIANLADSLNQEIDASIDINQSVISFLENYVGTIFGDIQGTASGKLRLVGNLKHPDLVGSIQLKDGGIKVLYTQCFYKIKDATIEFRPGIIDFGSLQLTDKFNNPGTLSGTLSHEFFKKFGYDITASSQKLLLLNTNKTDNSLFYGTAIGHVAFRFQGPETNMRMYVNAGPVDSSKMSILTSGTAKQKGEVEYIVWKQYGREMNPDSLRNKANNLTIDLDLSANPFLNMNVILDEVTGDIITATGTGSIKIHTGTTDRMTLNGRYNIDRGNYLFNFQDIFNKPFTLEPGSGSYISWSGDPYDADININATYLAEKVRMSTLFEDTYTSSGISTVGSDVLKEMSDVRVLCNLTGTLSRPNPSFLIELPPNSPVKNNPAVDSKLKTINRDLNEVSKQATYLIVFKSFAPPAAIVSSDINSELINTTISGVITSILSNSVQNLFYKILGPSVDVNFNYSRVLTNQTGDAVASNNQSNIRENVSLQFIKSVLNNKLIITFGSDFNFAATGGAQTSNVQGFLFLPDVNVEYKISPDGRLRTAFFYRSSFDALSTSGKQDRTGGNLSYRTEFDNLFGSRKKKTAGKKGDTGMAENN